MDIRGGVREAIKSMLASASGLSSDGDLGKEEKVVWKVLVLDAAARETLAPLMSVNELRRLGVTSHLKLEDRREMLCDAVGVYVCRPTMENAATVARDAALGLYGAFHVNFSSRVERKVLEGMARELAAGLDPAARNIPKLPVWDRTLDFVPLEPKLFDLGRSNSLEKSTNPDSNFVESLATGIACACATVFVSQGVPIVRCAPKKGTQNNTSELVARAVAKKLADAAEAQKKNLHRSTTAVGYARRPVVVVLDRFDDLATPLRHTETYQALVDDVLGLERNRATWPGANQTYDLAVDADDEFFAQHAQRSLPDVIDASSEDLHRLREAERRVRARGTGGVGNTDGDQGGGLSDAVGELPAILEQKKRLEAHTSILSAVMNRVVARELPRYYDVEDAQRFDKALFGELLEPSAKGSVQDKLRLLFVKGLDTRALSDDDLTKFQDTLKSGHPDDLPLVQTAFQVLNTLRASRVSNFGTSSSNAAAAAASNAQETGPTFAKMLSKARSGATQLVDKAAAGVSNLLTAKSAFASRVVDDLMDLKGKTHDEYLYIDPLDPAGNLEVPPSAEAHFDALCFMVGGGSYAEYHALQAALANSPRTLVYGASQLLRPEQLLHALIKVVAPSSA